jgi:hypothetical protein
LPHGLSRPGSRGLDRVGERDVYEATAASKAAHLAREAEELRNDPADVREMADVFLLLSHISDGYDLVAAAREKLEENKRRSWGQPDAEGVVEHVREAPEAAPEKCRRCDGCGEDRRRRGGPVVRMDVAPSALRGRGARGPREADRVPRLSRDG